MAQGDRVTALARPASVLAPPAGRGVRQLPDAATPGVADARLLPDDEFSASWDAVILPRGMKNRILRTAVAGIRLRARVAIEALPLHGVLLLTGKPGVGKTTVARGLADRLARAMPGASWAFIEVDPHALASSALGRSQRSVEQLFSQVLAEHAAAGPLIVLVDEVETLLTDRAGLSTETNPIDVHRAVDAALVGLDRLARDHKQVIVIATSNYPEAIDGAFASRADLIIEIPLPDRQGREVILRATIDALVAAFPGAADLGRSEVISEAAVITEGVDARRLRKAVAEACAWRAEAQGDPDRVTGADLLAVLNNGGQS
jgi:SpoVK/Ycf46/Vps4 family AAA+-type ATPase